MLLPMITHCIFQWKLKTLNLSYLTLHLIQLLTFAIPISQWWMCWPCRDKLNIILIFWIYKCMYNKSSHDWKKWTQVWGYKLLHSAAGHNPRLLWPGVTLSAMSILVSYCIDFCKPKIYIWIQWQISFLCITAQLDGKRKLLFSFQCP